MRAKISPCRNCKVIPELKEPKKKVGALYWVLEHPKHASTCPAQFRLRCEHRDPNDCVYEWNKFNKTTDNFSNRKFMEKIIKGFSIEKQAVRLGFKGSSKRPEPVPYWKKEVPEKEGWYWMKYRGKRGIVICPGQLKWASKDLYYMISTAKGDFFSGNLGKSKRRCIGFMIGAKLKEPPANPPKPKKDPVPARI